eukprot:SAG22_NODE_1782_length_3594_cov_4.062947_1_plen_99_part_00
MADEAGPAEARTTMMILKRKWRRKSSWRRTSSWRIGVAAAGGTRPRRVDGEPANDVKLNSAVGSALDCKQLRQGQSYESREETIKRHCIGIAVFETRR